MPVGRHFTTSAYHLRSSTRPQRILEPITGAIVGRQPFGGFHMSGGGTKAGGPDYLLNFLDPRCISENTQRRGFVPEV